MSGAAILTSRRTRLQDRNPHVLPILVLAAGNVLAAVAIAFARPVTADTATLRPVAGVGAPAGG